LNYGLVQGIMRERSSRTTWANSCWRRI